MIFLVILILSLTVLGFAKNGIEWSVFPGFAIVFGLFLHTALLADGSITEVSGGTTSVIASASTATTSVWQAIQFVPLILMIIPFLVVVFKVGSAFKG